MSGISGLDSRILNRLYTKNGNGEYILLSQQRQYEIKKLYKQLNKGLISESEFRIKMQELKSAPRVLYPKDNNSTSELKPNSVDKNKQNDSELGQKSKRYEKELIEKKEKIEKLKQNYAAGLISDFEYKANMYLLTSPVIDSKNNDTGKNLSLYA